MTEEIERILRGSAELNKMFAALQRTSQSLRRDFGEVENLQQSLRSARDFVSKAQVRIEESILSDLMLVRPSAGLLTPNVFKTGDGRDEFILSFSGAANFVRANPNFAISLALRTSDETRIALIYFPIDERLYYAESGCGAYTFTTYHCTKIKTSNLSELSELTIAYNVSGGRKMGLGENRITGCPAGDMAYVAAGKFDAFISDALDFADIAAGELIIAEAGGKFTMGEELVATNGKAFEVIAAESKKWF